MKIKCMYCGDIIEGDKRGTYISCKCKKTAIDETLFYCRTIGDNWKEVSKWEKKKKPIYLYDKNMNFIRKFDTTDDFAEYSGKEREYINYNLKYCKRIRIDGEWFIIKRNKE